MGDGDGDRKLRVVFCVFRFLLSRFLNGFRLPWTVQCVNFACEFRFVSSCSTCVVKSERMASPVVCSHEQHFVQEQ